MEYYDYIDDGRFPLYRMIRDRTNPVNVFDDFEFRDRFRLHKPSVVQLVMVLSPEIDHFDHRGHPLPPIFRVLICLRFYADGSSLRTIGDLFGVDASTVSKTVHFISRRITKKMRSLIVLRDGDLDRNKRLFYEIANFPGKLSEIFSELVHVLTRNRRKNYTSLIM